jgi:exodeoxyribonuclease VII small subunit
MAKAPTVKAPDKSSSDLLTDDLSENIPANLPASYEAAQRELEQLVAKLESGDLALEQLLVGYKRGAVLLEFCRAKLTAVEQQIKVLDGSVLKPWNPK